MQINQTNIARIAERIVSNELEARGFRVSDLNSDVSGIHVQVCGDCHLMNFAGFATPERRLIFDINDLDDTLPAPSEWDVKWSDRGES